MRIDRLGTSLAMLCAILLLAACGKGGGASAANGEPLSNVAPVAAQGAVSLATRNTTRLGGADPATDAAAVARAVYPALTPATRPPLVVLVDERDWPAALAASALAGAPLGAPLLFSRGNSLPDVSRQTLEALAPLGAPALGGVQVLRIGTSAAVPKGYLTRTLARAQPPDAAAAIEPLLQSGEAPAAHAVIVLPAAATPALAMPAAGLAAESGAPILFVTQAGVPASTAAVLKRLGHPSIYVIDSAQIGAPALAALRRFGPLTNLATGSEGADPAATAIAVARFADGKFGWGVKEPGHGLVFANAAAVGDRRLRPAAADRKPSADPGRAGELPRRHPAGLHAGLQLPARQGRLQSRLADRRRTRDRRRDTGRTRLAARDQPAQAELRTVRLAGRITAPGRRN
jgi:hypothetical protein